MNFIAIQLKKMTIEMVLKIESDENELFEKLTLIIDEFLE